MFSPIKERKKRAVKLKKTKQKLVAQSNYVTSRTPSNDDFHKLNLSVGPSNSFPEKKKDLAKSEKVCLKKLQFT